MPKYEKIVLQNLLKSGYALGQRHFLDTFTSRDRSNILKAIENLEQKLIITRDYSEDGITIVLPKNKITDALRIVSSIKIDDRPYLSIEELIPKKYSKPFLIKEGEKKIHGKVSKYVFCHTRTDPDDVTCFVINHKGSIHPIHLGSIYDPASMISAFLKEIDAKFPQVLFTRENLKTSLPKKLTQNNQPTKAAVEYLCHAKFLVRHAYDTSKRSKFERTGKPHPIEILDEMIALCKPNPEPYTGTDPHGCKYGYHEEDGLYPILD